jgi:ribosomal protein L2
VRRRLVAATAALGIVLTAPAQALAANVSASCGGGGYFVTRGTADNWQDHTHDGGLWHTWYYGRSFKSHSWGWESGTEVGTVNGPNLANPSAICPA